MKWESLLDWSIGLTSGVSILILAGIVISRFVFRGRQTEPNALWFHLLSLGIFPLFLLVPGNIAVFEYSKEVRFCGSCHLTMKPYIEDLHNAKSQSLAALHFQHRVAPGHDCYSCHVDYGVHALFEAKKTGLRHVYKYATGTYHLPLQMRGPFDNTHCLKCHEGAKRFMAHEVHLENGRVAPDLRTGKTECVQCHAPAHELPKTQRAGLPDGRR
jgi:nitrate/TMAO reductase-like tetraheme cytochrome c subunit